VRIRLENADSVAVEDPLGEVLLHLPRLLAATAIKIPKDAKVDDRVVQTSA
jgi:hypothetical protein